MSAHVFNPDRLREEREALGLSIAEVSRRAGIARSTLSRIEAGRSRDPRLGTAFGAARVLRDEREKRGLPRLGYEDFYRPA